MKRFLILSSLLILTRIADAQTTYLYTPNLANEANPLVYSLKFNWTKLIISEIVLLALLIYCLWVYCFRNVQVQRFDNRTTLRQFISLFYFDNTTSFGKVLYKLPSNKNSLSYSFGFILTYALICISIIITCSTIFLLTIKGYKKIYLDYNFPAVIYFLSILTVAYFAIKFYKTEYQIRVVN